MKVIKPYFEILSEVEGSRVLKNIELCGRTCNRNWIVASMAESD